MHIVHRGTDRHGAVGQRRDFDAGRQRGLQFGQQFLNPIHHLDHIGAWLALDVDDDRRLVVSPGGQAHVFGAVYDFGNVRQFDRRGVFVSHHQFAVFGRRTQLIVAVYCRGAGGAVD